MFEFLKNNEDKIEKMVPDKWMVYSMGQSPVHMLWYCQLLEKESLLGDGPVFKITYAEEYDDPITALKVAIKMIEDNEIIEKPKG